ncbi:MAG: DUF1553 domain-containing protein [Acidobacteria bacterium]|nr:DUF1553 domain-containing protein [Acidobacteriota bacterium]
MKIALLAASSLLGADGLAVLKARCAGCHSGVVVKSGLDVTSRKALLRGGDRGPAVVPGAPAESLLYKAAARTAEPHMPYKSPALPAGELALLAKWIDAGALFEEAAAVSRDTTHWAFQPVIAKPGGVDTLVERQRAALGLRAADEANRRTLARRLYVDVVGVPPTVAEMQAFLNDTRRDAYAALVDKLLADPRYGERWGRHWMDVWRYSDWYGWRKANDVRFSAKFIWRWRDWIVESLNSDKGYDQMIREMLAGDEIAPGDPDVLRATGFLARNFSKYDRDGWMQDAVDHTAMAFLGLTVKCARCHDHKYDPIRQVDYYNFRAFFEPYQIRADRVAGEADINKDGLSRIYDAHPGAATKLYVRGNVQEPDPDVKISPAVPGALAGELEIRPVALQVQQYYPDLRPFVLADLMAKAKDDTERARAAFEKSKDPIDAKALAAAEAYVPALAARIAADQARYSRPPDPRVEELSAEARKAQRTYGRLKATESVLRANQELADNLDEKKVPALQKQLQAALDALKQDGGGEHMPVGEKYPETSSGRRTALAGWIASEKNPLTARVAVNHMWMRHFGTPLVETPADFGRNGKTPVNQELLDWLAHELTSHNWSMKHIHRLLLQSKTYRMRSNAADASNAKIDPENRYLWRMHSRRMESEAVRDSLLAVSGALDWTRGGAEIDADKAFDSKRRSLYLQHTPDVPAPFLKIFDGANPMECYRREETVVPHQALALANSEMSRALARTLAAKISGTGDGFVKAAFETVLGRPPSASELRTAAAFTAKPEDREDLVHVLFNHNDFVTVH